MALPILRPPLTKAAYLQKLHSGTEAYKTARDQVEAIFNKSPGLPDVAHTPLVLRLNQKTMSDEENVNKKQELYQWDRSDGYPPHIKVVPYEDQVNILKIFSALRLLQVKNVDGNVKEFFGSGGDESKVTMQSLEERYADLAKEWRLLPDIYTAPNIGLRPDWYTDAVFAQQSFTGVNPIGIRQVSTVKAHDWLAEFRQAASDQHDEAFLGLLSSTPIEDFYVVDNSDYRKIVGLDADTIIVSGVDDGGDPQNPVNSATGAPPVFGAASVTLFTLGDNGILHPVAICLDYVGPLGSSSNGSVPSKSVTIFNRKVTPSTPGVEESTDWPWRFAKMTALMSDWSRHELTSHLTETHLVEEALIIAIQRNLPDNHIVCELLHPHWYKTLSLNVMARSTLVPDYIKSIAPLPLDKLMQFINQTYLDFDFVGRYVPNELASRGFSIDSLKLDADKANGGKFHNYLYARGVAETWKVLRDFVSEVLKSAYPNGDADVKADKYISSFCAEMRRGAGTYSPAAVPQVPPKKEGWWDTIKKDAEAVVGAVESGVDSIVHSLEGTTHTNLNKPFDLGPSKVEMGGAMASFPSPQTLDELIDMVTMCIHIAVPQHNAVNYLQQFYLSFIPNRPASFAAPLPTTIDQLQSYTEDYVIASLPLHTEGSREQWMTMAQVPYLLSAEVDPDSNMIHYVQDVKKSKNRHIRGAATNFEKAVGRLEKKFDGFNGEMDDKTTPYRVLNPEFLALSILI